MHAVIPAAGEGTRLRPRTLDKPKPLVEVAGKPLLAHVLDTVAGLGIESAVVVVGYEGEQIIEYFGDTHEGIDLTFAHQEPRDGLAHAVLAAEAHVEGDVLVLNGDNVYDANLGQVLARHRETESEITMPVAEVRRETAREGAVCELDDDGKVVGLVEKPDDPPSTTVPMAAYVLPSAIFLACERIDPSERGEYELPAAIDRLLQAGATVETVPFEGWRVNVNTEADIRKAELRLQDGE